MAMIERESGTQIGAGIPAWITQLVLPVSFTLIALRLVWRVGRATLQEDLENSAKVDDASALARGSAQDSRRGTRERWIDRAIASIGILAGIVFAQIRALEQSRSWAAAILIVAAAFLGTPLFAISAAPPRCCSCTTA